MKLIKLFKKVVYYFGMQKCKIRYASKDPAKFHMTPIIIKVLINPPKLRNEEHKNYFIYKMIMNVRTIGNLQ